MKTTQKTTTSIMTTTPEPGTCDDIEYSILDDHYRNVHFANNGNDELCDQVNQGNNQSPDWKGPGWYRISGEAGTQIPENPVESLHCHTHSTGWLDGNHPTNVGETVYRRVCFNLYQEHCWREIQIEVKNCGDFFLYYLENTPGCNLRYCST